MKEAIILIVLAIISQVVAAAKKSQAEARRRALEAQNRDRQPPTRRAAPPPPEEDEWDEPEPEPEPVEARAPEREVEVVPRFQPPARASLAAALTGATHLLNTPTTSLSPAPRRPAAIRFDRKRLKDAIIMMEVIGPPVSMR